VDLALADLAAILHAAFIVFLISGGVACLRWPRLVPYHLVAVVGMAAVNLTGSDCPFTVVQKHFLERSGRMPYDGGFVEHYLVEPVWSGGITAGVRAVIITCWVLPTVVAYALLARRRRLAVA
jgi:hypothetical protein